MNTLLLFNALLFIALYVVWSKSDVLNATFKVILLILALCNGYQSYQGFEVARLQAKAASEVSK